MKKAGNESFTKYGIITSLLSGIEEGKDYYLISFINW